MKKVFQRILDDILIKDIKKKDRKKLRASVCEHKWEYFGRPACSADSKVLDKFLCMECGLTVYRQKSPIHEGRFRAGVWTTNETVTREIIK